MVSEVAAAPGGEEGDAQVEVLGEGSVLQRVFTLQARHLPAPLRSLLLLGWVLASSAWHVCLYRHVLCHPHGALAPSVHPPCIATSAAQLSGYDQLSPRGGPCRRCSCSAQPQG